MSGRAHGPASSSRAVAVDPGGEPGRAGHRRLVPAFIVLVLAAALLAFDLRRPPASQWSGRAMVAGIELYRAALSPTLARLGIRCRFRPTCSHFAASTIREEGALRGSIRALQRVSRCGPWTPEGTADPP